MRAIIVGAGKTGSFLAGDMAAAGHQVVLVEKDARVLEHVGPVAGVEVLRADGCDPEKLDLAVAHQADLVVALTGDDEDNLVISWLAKHVFNVGRVIARVNNPKNRWLYTADWGVDVPVSSLIVISKLIEEQAAFGQLVTLMKLRRGEISLVEITLTDTSPSIGRRLEQLEIPADAVIVALLRADKALVAAADIQFQPGDVVLALTPSAKERELVTLFAA